MCLVPVVVFSVLTPCLLAFLVTPRLWVRFAMAMNNVSFYVIPPFIANWIDHVQWSLTTELNSYLTLMYQALRPPPQPAYAHIAFDEYPVTQASSVAPGSYLAVVVPLLQLCWF